MNENDLSQFRNEFEAIKKQAFESCDNGSCETEQATESFDDYPDYVRAIYAEVMPPIKSGIYFSRWDIKGMAAELDEHIVIDVRERMFQHFMRFIVTKDDMQDVVNQFKKHIDMKCDLYKEYMQKYPSTSAIFETKITKASRAKEFLDKMIVDFFS
jgi:hypothetical protein